MFDNKKILCLIPARGGSKGVPGKNIKPIAGHPLISYTIQAARASKYIDDIVVTTDSEKIAEVARRYGALVPFLRPEELAQDHSKSIDAIVHAVGELEKTGKKYHSVIFLQPTSPLRRSSDINASLELFYKRGCLGLASVCEVSESPVLARRMDRSGVLHPLLPISSTVRRQELPDFWHVNGAIYINLADELTSDTSLNDNPIGYVMPEGHSFDIDDIEDFYKAEEAIRQLDAVSPEVVSA